MVPPNRRQIYTSMMPDEIPNLLVFKPKSVDSDFVGKDAYTFKIKADNKIGMGGFGNVFRAIRN
jgi:hypothetical protein